MDRNQMLGALTEGTFDLLVVGGGITGTGVAREASLRGLRVALVERLDFAWGTSSRSTKLIHGGLRYLKQFDFKLVREAVEERQRLLEMAPHEAVAVPFLFPVYQGDPDSLLALRAGLFMYDLFARMRAAVPHRILRPAELLAEEPGLRREELVGGAVYTDARTDDGRLTLTVAKSAVAHGATLANYVEVESFTRRANGRVAGAHVRDTLSGQAMDVRALHVLAAAGPWADHLRRLDDPDAPEILRLTKGVHLTVRHDRLPIRHAVVIRGRDKRMMFAIPSHSYTYLGTTDTDYTGDPAAVAIDRDDVEYILDAGNRAFPEAEIGFGDVVSAWVGLRPLVKPPGTASPSSVSRDYALFHSPSGLVSVGGGKLTAFRAMASHIVDVLFPATRTRENERLSTAPLPGAEGPLPGAAEWERYAAQTGVPAERLEEWCARYGIELRRVAELLPSPLGGDAAVDWHRAMTRYAVQHEMAQRLEDVYRRRTGLMLFSDDNGRGMLETLAQDMGALLDWTPERTREEVDHTRALLDRMFAWRNDPASARGGGNGRVVSREAAVGAAGGESSARPPSPGRRTPEGSRKEVDPTGS